MITIRMVFLRLCGDVKNIFKLLFEVYLPSWGTNTWNTALEDVRLNIAR